MSLNQKSSLVSGNWPSEIFLSPTRPHKSNLYENIYFLFQKAHKETKKFPLANLFARIYVFTIQIIKDTALCFSTMKSVVRVFFLCVNFFKKFN